MRGPDHEQVRQWLSEAWGQVQPVPWIEARLSVQPLATIRMTRVTVHVKVGQHMLAVPDGRGGVARIGRASHRATGECDVAEQVVYTTREPIERVLHAAVQGAIREVSWFLGEKDPRIGSVRPSLPRCPLFDPVRVLKPRRVGVDLADTVPCPFCGEDFDNTEAGAAMWAGACVQWAHPACWISVSKV